jgi:hypothetical protein
MPTAQEVAEEGLTGMTIEEMEDGKTPIKSQKQDSD